MHEVHVFVGSAASLVAEATGHPVGERHAVLVFLRQLAATTHDFAGAEALLEAESWGNVALERGGTLGPVNDAGEFADMHRSALAKGGAIVVYSKPLPA